MKRIAIAACAALVACGCASARKVVVQFPKEAGAVAVTVTEGGKTRSRLDSAAGQRISWRSSAKKQVRLIRVTPEAPRDEVSILDIADDVTIGRVFRSAPGGVLQVEIRVHNDTRRGKVGLEYRTWFYDAEGREVAAGKSTWKAVAIGEGESVALTSTARGKGAVTSHTSLRRWKRFKW